MECISFKKQFSKRRAVENDKILWSKTCVFGIEQAGLLVFVEILGVYRWLVKELYLLS